MEELMEKIKELFNKYKEVIMYLIIGVLTTIINYVIFAVAVWLGLEELTSNIIAWIITIIVAYILNKLFVFESKSFEKSVITKEIISFTVARIATLGVEEAMLLVFVKIVGLNPYIIKLVANIVVIILNYIFSKFIIFKKDKKITKE
jgi:putative flippase GtrA